MSLANTFRDITADGGAVHHGAARGRSSATPARLSAVLRRESCAQLGQGEPRCPHDQLCNDAYASLASGVTHGALWSAEHPTAASLAAASATPREGDFHSDDRLPFADQAQLADYRTLRLRPRPHDTERRHERKWRCG